MLHRPLWLYVQQALESHGWALLCAVLLVHVLRKRYREYAAQRHLRRTFAAATDPTRVAVLQQAAAHVRDKQQQEFQAQSIKVTQQQQQQLKMKKRLGGSRAGGGSSNTVGNE